MAVLGGAYVKVGGLEKRVTTIEKHHVEELGRLRNMFTVMERSAELRLSEAEKTYSERATHREDAVQARLEASHEEHKDDYAAMETAAFSKMGAILQSIEEAKALFESRATDWESTAQASLVASRKEHEAKYAAVEAATTSKIEATIARLGKDMELFKSSVTDWESEAQKRIVASLKDHDDKYRAAKVATASTIEAMQQSIDEAKARVEHRIAHGDARERHCKAREPHGDA